MQSLRNGSHIGPEVTILESSKERSSKKKIAESLSTLNKLNFSSLGLVGRDEEISALKTVLQRQFEDENSRRKRELILVSGYSGTGKSILITQTLQRSVCKKYKGIFVTGKCSISHQGQPYSGISNACNDLCRFIIQQKQSNKENFSKIRKEIIENIDASQIDLLEEGIIPALSDILSSDSTETEVKAETGNEFSLNTLSSSPLKSTDDTLQDGEDCQSQQGLGGFGRWLSNPRNQGDSKNTRKSRSLSSSAPRITSIDPSATKFALKYAFMNFIQIISSHFPLMVIFIDDLQWADTSTLHLLSGLIKDDHNTMISNLIIAGSFRSNEVDEIHTLSKTIRDLRALKEDKRTYNITEISIGNLCVESVNQMIVDLLSVSYDKAFGLANICHKRTLGNAFFIKVFLTTLQEKGLLQFNVGTFQWVWDQHKIEEETFATDNVIEFIKAKMSAMPNRDILSFLRLASCLGNRFDRTIIDLVWEKVHVMKQRLHGLTEDALDVEEKHDKTISVGSIDTLLKISVDEMFLETINASSYRFVHDKVLEAAKSLIPPEMIASLQNSVGWCLVQNLSEQELERMLFTIVNLLNNGALGDDDEFSCSSIVNNNRNDIDIARLNLRAAQKAREVAAFQSAVRYIEVGIKRLTRMKGTGKEDMWVGQYQLALCLHSIGAEMEYVVGNQDTSNWYCKEVIRYANASPFDKIGVYKIMAERFYSRKQYKEALDTCVDILEQLGCCFPKAKLQQKLKLQSYLQQTKNRYLPNVKDIGKMPFIEDPERVAMIAMMMKAAEVATSADELMLYPLFICRCVRWTTKYGITDYTVSLFSSFANLLMHQTGDWVAAVNVAEIANALRERVKSNYTISSMLWKTNAFVFSWTKPLKSCRKSFLESYTLGNLSGNVEAAAIATMYGILIDFLSGTSLSLVEEDLQNHVPEIYRLGQMGMVEEILFLWQQVLNLIDDPLNKSTTALTGTIMQEKKYVDGVYAKFLNVHKCNLCAYFGEYDLGAEIALAMGNQFYERWKGIAYSGFDFFPRGICLYAMAQKTRQRRFITAAVKVRSYLRYFVEKGAVNLVHHLLILDAEGAVLRGKDSVAGVIYTKAIVQAARSGFLQDAGLAHERYAILLLAKPSLHNQTDARYHVEEAIKFYSEWGALKKVRLLREKYTTLLDDCA